MYNLKWFWQRVRDVGTLGTTRRDGCCKSSVQLCVLKVNVRY